MTNIRQRMSAWPTPDHNQALQAAVRITTNLRRLYKPMASTIEPQDVIKTLNQARINFTLVGAQGIAGWLDEPRATQDVDILIHSRHKKAVQVLATAYPDLKVQDFSAVTRFLDPADNLAVIDLIKSQVGIHKAVAKNYCQVGKTHRIPNLEMALALKFAALSSPNRTMKKRHLDQADFIGIVTKNHEIVDLDKLHRLGEIVKKGGGKEVLRMVEGARSEKEIEPQG